MLRRNDAARPLDSRSAYALWAALYPAEAHNPLMVAEQQALLSLLPPVAGLRILDLACGSGRYGLIAQRAGTAQVLGTDNSRPMLRQAAFPVAEAELDALPFPDSAFDGIICGLALGHLSAARMDRSIAEMARALRPGGWVVLSDFHPFLALAGHQRTFRGVDGRLYAAEHHVHLLADYFAAAQGAGLTFDAISEPTSREAPTTAPVALVIRLRKPAPNH